LRNKELDAEIRDFRMYLFCRSPLGEGTTSAVQSNIVCVMCEYGNVIMTLSTPPQAHIRPSSPRIWFIAMGIVSRHVE
jgi:hypothetical protein